MCWGHWDELIRAGCLRWSPLSSWLCLQRLSVGSMRLAMVATLTLRTLRHESGQPTPTSKSLGTGQHSTAYRNKAQQSYKRNSQ